MIDIPCGRCGGAAIETNQGRGYCLGCGWTSHPAAPKPPPAVVLFRGEAELSPEARAERERARSASIAAEWKARGERRK